MRVVRIVVIEQCLQLAHHRLGVRSIGQLCIVSFVRLDEALCLAIALGLVTGVVTGFKPNYLAKFLVSVAV